MLPFHICLYAQALRHSTIRYSVPPCPHSLTEFSSTPPYLPIHLITWHYSLGGTTVAYNKGRVGSEMEMSQEGAILAFQDVSGSGGLNPMHRQYLSWLPSFHHMARVLTPTNFELTAPNDDNATPARSSLIATGSLAFTAAKADAGAWRSATVPMSIDDKNAVSVGESIPVDFEQTRNARDAHLRPSVGLWTCDGNRGNMHQEVLIAVTTTETFSTPTQWQYSTKILISNYILAWPTVLYSSIGLQFNSK